MIRLQVGRIDEGSGAGDAHGVGGTAVGGGEEQVLFAAGVGDDGGADSGKMHC